MAKQTVNIGTAANDGTGDPIRDAFNKVNQNFDEVYSSYVATGTVTAGNTTVNTSISNTTGLFTGNSTVSSVANSTAFKTGNSTANSIQTATDFSIIGTATIGNAYMNTSTLFIGNSTVNTSHSILTLQIANSTSNATINAGSLFIGNATVNTTANSSYLKVGTANVTTNTLTLGTSTDAANGYTFLPNGFKLNWGWTTANSTVGNAIFTAAYTTNAYVITATRSSNATNNNDTTYAVSIQSQNSSTVQIRTSNATSINVYWMAIGK